VVPPSASAGASTASAASPPDGPPRRQVLSARPASVVTSGAADPMVRSLLGAVRVHRPGDAREVRSREEILESLLRLPRPFDRSADLTHVTASAVVVGPRGVLLHRHRRLHRWMQPGGHLDPGESPEMAAVRETVEETGLAVHHPATGPVLVHVDVHGATQGHVHLDIRYVLAGPDADPAPPPGESQEVAWFSWDDAEDLADEALAGALRTARRLTATGRTGRTSEESDG
jgi:8-oxo-dGTP pyrophosphatase MutT (NUDIX family)